MGRADESGADSERLRRLGTRVMYVLSSLGVVSGVAALALREERAIFWLIVCLIGLPQTWIMSQPDSATRRRRLLWVAQYGIPVAILAFLSAWIGVVAISKLRRGESAAAAFRFTMIAVNAALAALLLRTGLRRLKRRAD